MIKLVNTLLLLVCAVCTMSAQRDSSDVPDSPVADTLVVELKSTDLIDSVLSYAGTFSGCRYGYGSCGPKTFDCSGFVMHVYGKFGMKLPHSSGALYASCEQIKLRRVKAGDLLFFSGRKVSKKNIGHVAIVKEVEGDRISMIHATVQAGVIEEVMQDSEYFSKRFISAGRLKDLN